MLRCTYVRAGDRDARREAATRAPGATPASPRAPPPPRSLRTVVVSQPTTAAREARCVPKAWGRPATRCTGRPAAAAPPADWSQQHGRCEGRRQAVQMVQCAVQRATRASRHACIAPRAQGATAWHGVARTSEQHHGSPGETRKPTRSRKPSSREKSYGDAWFFASARKSVRILSRVPG